MEAREQQENLANSSHQEAVLKASLNQLLQDMGPFLRNVNITNTFSDDFIMKENFSPGLGLQERKLIHLCKVLGTHIEALELEREECYRELSELKRINSIRRCETTSRGSAGQDKFHWGARDYMPSSSYYGSQEGTENGTRRRNNAHQYEPSREPYSSNEEYQNSIGRNPYT